MTSKIFLEVAGGLVAMAEAPYEAEDVLQSLLADHPDLLAGDQMEPLSPRRWMLITRELGVPDQIGAPDRFSLDHLFVDQDGIPTLIEVKRSSDTRLRREVVGQLLDYAANVAAYWPAAEARRTFEARSEREGVDSSALIQRLLGQVTDADGPGIGSLVDSFWERVSQNLAARHMRLIFVADVIPRELQRIVEFLNESMVRTEVLAVEVKQFASTDGLTRTFVPRVIGQTAAAEDLKRTTSPRSSREWDTASFTQEAARLGVAGAASWISDLANWIAETGLGVAFGAGRYGPMYVEIPMSPAEVARPFAINASGTIELLFVNLKEHGIFQESEARHELKRRLNRIRGISIRDDQAETGTWPSIRADVFQDPAAREAFKLVIGWVAAQLQAVPEARDQ